MRDVGTQVLEGQEIKLPPVVLAQYGCDPAKKVFYSLHNLTHY